VLAEFREMPGLRLTLTQAARLFDIEPAHCSRVLGSLVDSGFLAMDGNVFAAADGGRRTA
jgi:DNA-binding IclR family transcriptional regulator